LFRDETTGWTLDRDLGISFSLLSGDQLLLGGRVLTRNGPTWTEPSSVELASPDSAPSCGSASLGSLSQDRLAVRANQVICVYTRTSSGFSDAEVIPLSSFALAQAFSGDTLAIGVIDPSTLNCTVQILRHGASSAWAEEATIPWPDCDRDIPLRLALSGDLLAFGSPGDASAVGGIGPDEADAGGSAYHTGAVRVYARTGTTWVEEAYIKPQNAQVNSYFGSAVALGGGTLAVGAPLEAGGGAGINGAPAETNDVNGAAYVFTRVGSTWTQRTRIKPPPGAHVDSFGSNVALSDTRLVVAGGDPNGDHLWIY
jgi:hypothetical protein